MKDKVILFIPVERRYLDKWEYYRVDFDALCSIYSSVVICTSIIEVIKNLRDAHLIYCWWWHRSAHVVVLARLLHVRVCVTGAIHMFDLSGSKDFYSKSFLYRFFTKIALLLADDNFFISRDQFLQVTSHLSVNRPAVVLSSLTKTSQSSSSSIAEQRARFRQRKINSDKKVFVTVCWHTEEQYQRKGVYETLQALSDIKKKSCCDFTWIIAGGAGDGVEALMRKISAAGLEANVQLKIDISQEEKNKLFILADLYIQPSWHEGFGNAVLEAMSHGLPALVSRYTAQPEVVGDCGFIAMEMSAEAVSHQLKKFLSLDSASREVLEDQVTKRVARFFLFDRRVEAIRRCLSRGDIDR